MMRYLLPLLVCLALVAGCGETPPTLEPGEGEAPLRFGMVPFHALPVLYRESSAIAGYLSANLGRPIRFVLVPDYASIAGLLTKEQLDLAWLTPLPYMKFGASWKYDILCTPVRRGRTSHRGVIVVRADGPLRSIEDLRGRTFAYVDRFSTSGCVYPNLLLERHGVDPLSFFGAVEFSNTHTASLLGVLEGRYDAAAVYDQAHLTVLTDVQRSALRVLARTDEIPSDPIVIHRSLSPELHERLRDLFLTMPVQPGGAAVAAVLAQEDGITAFGITSEEAYRSSSATTSTSVSTATTLVE